MGTQSLPSSSQIALTHKFLIDFLVRNFISSLPSFCSLDDWKLHKSWNRTEKQHAFVSLVDYQTFVWFVQFKVGGLRDYDSIFLATVIHRGPRIMRIVSMISCVARSSTISSFICPAMRRNINSISWLHFRLNSPLELDHLTLIGHLVRPTYLYKSP